MIEIGRINEFFCFIKNLGVYVRRKEEVFDMLVLYKRQLKEFIPLGGGGVLQQLYLRLF
jgi:hypothetical protein